MVTIGHGCHEIIKKKKKKLLNYKVNYNGTSLLIELSTEQTVVYIVNEKVISSYTNSNRKLFYNFVKNQKKKNDEIITIALILNLCLLTLLGGN